MKRSSYSRHRADSHAACAPCSRTRPARGAMGGGWRWIASDAGALRLTGTLLPRGFRKSYCRAAKILMADSWTARTKVQPTTSRGCAPSSWSTSTSRRMASCTAPAAGDVNLQDRQIPPAPVWRLARHAPSVAARRSTTRGTCFVQLRPNASKKKNGSLCRAVFSAKIPEKGSTEVLPEAQGN